MADFIFMKKEEIIKDIQENPVLKSIVDRSKKRSKYKLVINARCFKEDFLKALDQL